MSIGNVTQPKVRPIPNAVAALAVAVFAVWSLSYVSVIWNPGRYGDFGLSIGDNNSLPTDSASYLVTSIVPSYAAEKAGIKLGDRVDAALPTRARLVLIRILAPRPGEEVTIHASRGSNRRTLTLQARPLAPQSATDSIKLALLVIANFIFVAVGLALVLLRPSRMTWGFYLLGVGWISASLPHSGNWPFSFIPTGWWMDVDISSDVLTAAGVVGFLAFSIRFPTNAPTGWLRTIDIFTPYMVATLAVAYLCADLSTQLLIPPVELTRLLWKVWFEGITAVAILGSLVLLIRFLRAHGPERHRIRWVVFGFMCASIALVALFGPFAAPPDWLIGVLDLLFVVFPLTVAYAVIRHRVIDVRFIISRSLVVAVIVVMVSLLVIGVDWLFTVVLPSSRFETATYFGVAVLIGLSLNAIRQRISRTIDVLFFRQWHQTQEQAETIGDTVRRATSVADLHEPLTAGIAHAFSLASAALFERVESGGFVRVAASAWPAGNLWQILPNDPLVVRADKRPRATDIGMFQWQGRGLPAGVARPTVMVPIVAGRHVPAMLLYGAHENGTALDADEIRAISRLCADASLVYSMALKADVERAAFVTSPLGAR